MNCFHILSALVFAVIAMALAGCETLEEEERLKIASQIMETRKEKSLEVWDEMRIGDEDARYYARTRILPLVDGRVTHSFKDVEIDEEGTMTANLVIKPAEGEDWDPATGLATATPITADGYFLTAAHCVETEVVTILARGEKAPKPVRARVVWSGQPADTGELDLALVHAPIQPNRHFPLDQVKNVHVGTQVIQAGLGGGNPTQAGGKVEKVGLWKNSEGTNKRWRSVYHDAPISQGDSGGPLIDDEGQLVGINVDGKWAHTRFLGKDMVWDYKSRAIHPDPEWIRKLIAEDRAKRQ